MISLIICSYCGKPNAVLMRCQHCNKLYCRLCMVTDILCFVCDIMFTKLKTYDEKGKTND